MAQKVAFWLALLVIQFPEEASTGFGVCWVGVVWVLASADATISPKAKTAKKPRSLFDRYNILKIYRIEVVLVDLSLAVALSIFAGGPCLPWLGSKESFPGENSLQRGGLQGLRRDR